MDVYFFESQEPSLENLKQIPELINNELSKFLDGRRMGLLCSVLDLRDEMKEHDLFGCKLYKTKMIYVLSSQELSCSNPKKRGEEI